MALYLNGESKQIFLNGIAYYLNIGCIPKPIEGILIKSSDGYIITDSNGEYLTLKESE